MTAPAGFAETAECCQCGEEARVCCNDSFDGEGNHVDPICVACCSCGTKPRRSFGNYERMDCDQ